MDGRAMIIRHPLERLVATYQQLFVANLGDPTFGYDKETNASSTEVLAKLIVNQTRQARILYPLMPSRYNCAYVLFLCFLRSNCC